MANLELKGLKLLRSLDFSLTGDKIIAGVTMTTLPIEHLTPGKYQPRKQFNESFLEELASSIRSQGIIQPLIVREVLENRYEIIAGERRWRAAKKVGLSHVPVVIKNVDDNIALAFSLIENIQREDLNPLEEANAFNRFCEEFQMTHEDIAQMVGRSRASITNTLRLLALELRVKNMLEKGQINMGHARSILTLEPEEQYRIACTIIDKQLSVRETESLANKFKLSSSQNKKNTSDRYHPKCVEWSTYLSEEFSTTVSVKISNEGKGKVIFEVNSADEVDWLIKMITERN